MVKFPKDDSWLDACFLGDEVIEWNGRCLQGKSFQEVYDIIAASRQEPQVELVVSRNLLSSTTLPGRSTTASTTTPVASRRAVAQSQWRQKHECIGGTQQPHHKGKYLLSFIFLFFFFLYFFLFVIPLKQNNYHHY